MLRKILFPTTSPATKLLHPVAKNQKPHEEHNGDEDPEFRSGNDPPDDTPELYDYPHDQQHSRQDKLDDVDVEGNPDHDVEN